MTVETTSRIRVEIERASSADVEAYLIGAAHDATRNGLHRTIRFCQAGREWIDILSLALDRVGSRSWIYKEGADRDCWVVESTWVEKLGTRDLNSAAYARGYFDAEGGIPRNLSARIYLQLVQKNFRDLADLRGRLERLGIACGSIHNPSARVDPDYWRFYVLARSFHDFGRRVGSGHPRKRTLLRQRSMCN